jgi:hypothetical protein
VVAGSVMIAAIKVCRETAYTRFSLCISVNIDFKFHLFQEIAVNFNSVFCS